jgi:signal transduction histidine kinase
MERKKVVFARSPIDPRQVVEQAAALVSGRFTANGHRFSMEVSGDPPAVLAEADALVTVLLNLLENAYKYSGTEKEASWASPSWRWSSRRGPRSLKAVHDAEGLRRALAGAKPGSRILIEPGEYHGGMSFAGSPGRAWEALPRRT